MKVVGRSLRCIRVRLDEDEELILKYRNKKTGEQRDIGAWFTPCLARFEMEKTKKELEEACRNYRLAGLIGGGV